MVLYVLMNVVYVRVLPVEGMAESGPHRRSGRGRALRPLGRAHHLGRRRRLDVRLPVLDHPAMPPASTCRWPRTACSSARWPPCTRATWCRSACLLAQGAWAIAQTFSGTYEQLYTYVTFALFVFHAATGAAVIVLRRTRPDVPRPYRTWGYPWVPLVFIGVVAVLRREHARRASRSSPGSASPSSRWACPPTSAGGGAARASASAGR